MKIRQLLLTLVMAVFVMNTITATAFAACNCAEMTVVKEQSVQEMPCHNMQEPAGEQVQANESDPQSPLCMKCGCGDCKIPSQAMLNPLFKSAAAIEKGSADLALKQIKLGAIAYGIENPPKFIS